MKLTTVAINEVRKNQRCKNRLALELDRSHSTIQRWLDNNEEGLTLTKSVQIISEETGLSKDEILTESIEA